MTHARLHTDRTAAIRATRVLLLVCALALGACATAPPEPPAPPPPPITKGPGLEPPVVMVPAPESEPEPPPPPPVTPEPQQVAVLVAGDAPAYREVAGAIQDRLGDREVLLLPVADERMATDGLFRKLEDDGVDALVAVGLPAARLASRHANVPVIFCQVFDDEQPALMEDGVRGVAALPPLDRQLTRWRIFDPELRAIGMLIGPGHERLVAEATDAVAEAGLELRLRQPSSDREALYLFQRMAADIDGLWLFPDNRILSPGVLKEMLDFALRRRVRVVVFSPALLGMGAFMSAETVAEDIARVTASVLDGLARGDDDSLPRISPLTEVSIRVNPTVARRLGLELSGPLDAGGYGQ